MGASNDANIDGSQSHPVNDVPLDLVRFSDFAQYSSMLSDCLFWQFLPSNGSVFLSHTEIPEEQVSTMPAVSATGILRRIPRSERRTLFDAFRRLFNRDTVEEDVEMSVLLPNGNIRHVRAAFRSVSGTKEMFSGFIQERIAAESLAEKLKILTYYDSITLLPNRKKFDEIVAEHIDYRNTYGGKFAFLIVDLTRFRRVNFALSHVVGDELLRLVAQRLRSTLGNRDEVARVGARFPILLQNEDGNTAMRRASELCRALEAPFQLGDISYEIGAHIGIALCPSDDLTHSGLLRKADIAVEQAAEKGQLIASYDAASDRHTASRLGLVGDFRRAVREGEIHLYCQPKIEMMSLKVVGAEVLARWKHPTKGLIPPDEFIPLIEGTELIHVLTNHMLECTAHCILRWQKLGIFIPLAVNLSTHDVVSPTLSRYLARLLLETNVDPKCIELEVTERSLICNVVESIRELTRLRDMGFRLSIDDFGTGFSSLNYLTQLPVDVIKIDHSFTMKMVDDKRSATIVRSTINMAHDLGMSVVAEGTENIDIWDALFALGCDEAQGYYIARPMPVEIFPEWFERNGGKFDAARPPIL